MTTDGMRRRSTTGSPTGGQGVHAIPLSQHPRNQVRQVVSEKNNDESYEESKPVIRPKLTKKPRKQLSGRAWALIVLIGSISTAYGLGFSALSRATVFQPSIEQPVPVSLSLRASSYPEDGSIQYETVTVTVSKSASVPFSQVEQSGQYARGTVRIFNETGRKQSVPTGSILVAPDEYRFVTENPITVPAKTKQGSGSFPVRARSEFVGSEGNRPNEDFAAVSKANGDQISGLFARTEDGGFTGGIAKDNPIINPTDLLATEQNLRTQLDTYVLPDSYVPPTYTTISGGRTASADRVATSVDNDESSLASVTMSRDYTYILLSKTELINSILGITKSPESPVPLKPTISSFKGLVVRISTELSPETEGSLGVALQGTVPVVFQYSQEDIASFVTGKKKRDVASALRKLPVPLSVSVFPPWKQSLPRDSGRIHLDTL